MSFGTSLTTSNARLLSLATLLALATLHTLTTGASAGIIDTQPGMTNVALGAAVAVENGILWPGGGEDPLKLTNGALNDQIHSETGAQIQANFGYLVDLGSTPAFESIDVISRGDGCCPERLSNFQVTVLEDDGGSAGGELWNSGALFVGSNPGSGARVSLAEGDGAGSFTGGRFVRVTSLRAPSFDYDLQIADLQVIAVDPNVQVPINYALGQPVATSGNVWGPGQAAALLTDGNRGTITHPYGPGGNPNEPTPVGFYYEVDMESLIELDHIDIYNRADGCCTERLSRFRVEVLDDSQTVVWTGDLRTDGSNSGVGGVDTVTADQGTGVFTGRYIRVLNNGGGDYSPQMGELEAYGHLVPEPATAVMLTLGLFGLVGCRRRRR